MRLVPGDGVRHVQPGKPRKHLLATAGLLESIKPNQVQRYGEFSLSWMRRRACLERPVVQEARTSVALSVWPDAVSDGLLPSNEAD